jgi:adenosylcobinamide-phosphate synthase
MTLISLLIALLLEQVRPIRQTNPIQSLLDQKIRQVRAMEVDSVSSAWMAWGTIVVGGAVGGLVIAKLLHLVHPILELAFMVGVLYLTLGFRQFSHWFSDIQAALRTDDVVTARQILLKWVDESHADAVARAAAEQGDASSVARESIRLALVAAQRHVFGVIFWFVILPGPAGALGYWLSVQLLKGWASHRVDAPLPAGALLEAEVSPADVPGSDGDRFAQVSSLAYRWIDWAPVRVTACIFAVVGNFEDSVSMWRSRAAASPEHVNDTDRVLVASGAGAMGVRLSVPDALEGSDGLDEVLGNQSSEPDLREASAASLDTAVGLVWRAVVMWCFMVLLFYLGRWLS